MRERLSERVFTESGLACIVRTWWILAVVLGALVVGCRPVDESGTSAADQHRAGGVDTPRVVALLPFAADQLLAMGFRPAAVPELRGEEPAAWAGIDRVALDHSAGPNIEQLIAAAPDVVVASRVYAQFVPAIERATDAEVVIMDIDSVSGVAEGIAELGRLTGRTDDARARVDELLSTVPTREESASPVSVLAVFGTPHSFYAVLPDSYLGDLIHRSGGALITDDMASHPVFQGLAPLSMETVVHDDPEQIIVIFHGPEATARAMLERDPLWSGLTAVETGAVAYLSDDLYAMRAGSQLDRAVREIDDIVRAARDRRR